MLKFVIFVLTVLVGTTAQAQQINDTRFDRFDARKLDIKKDKPVYLLTYFRQRYPTRIEIDEKGNIVEVPLPDPMLIEKMHMALSTDGRIWTPLNNNEPVWNQHIRDPFVHRGPDGLWRILSTGGGNTKRATHGPACFYLTSKDLITWKQEGSLWLMKDVRNDTGAMARNIWAPEWFYDEVKKEYLLIWSSSFQQQGWNKSKLWYCTTRDWKTFTTAKPFFEPPYSVIDGTLLKQNNQYYLFHKEEEFGKGTGERRAIRVAVSPNITGPYKIIDGHLNNGQIVPVITEGPSVIKDPTKPGWLLFYDYCMTNRFGVSGSADLTNWSVIDTVEFPSEARRGSVAEISADEAKKLIEAFSPTR